MLLSLVLSLCLSAPEPPPNVVIVLVDDLGWRDLGCQGSTFYETPHVDRLAAQGVRFTDAYAAAAVCSPTRAAVMTGRWPARLGVTDWIRARFQHPERIRTRPTEYVGGPKRRLLCPPNPYRLESGEITLAEALKAAGYVTCHIGKWHLGDDAWYPDKQGFDHNLGGCDFGQPPSYFDPYGNKLVPGIPTLAPRKKGEYLTDREADEAVGFLREHKDRPFFLYLAHYAVHAPIQAKEAEIARFRAKEKPHQGWPAYAAMIASVDEAVGRVLRTLDELDLADRTIVIFTSDNGGLLPVTNNAPLRSGKGYAYEGGLRVPLLVRWPGVASRVSHEPVCSVDFFPTILAAANAKVPPADGVSLVDHLRDGRPLGRAALFWHFPHYRHPPGPYSVVRAGRWKLIRYWEGPAFELYDLAADIGETRNLAAAQPERVEALDRRLLAHLEEVGAKLPRRNPDHQER